MSSLTPPRGNAGLKEAFLTPKRSNGTNIIISNNNNKSSAENPPSTGKSGSPEALKASTHRFNNSSSNNSISATPRRKLSLAVQKRRRQLFLSASKSTDTAKSVTTAPAPVPVSVPVQPKEPEQPKKKGRETVLTVESSTIVSAASNTVEVETVLSPTSTVGPTPKASGSGLSNALVVENNTNKADPPPKPITKEVLPSQDHPLSSQTWTPEESDEQLLHKACDELFPSSTMATTAVTPKASHRRTTRNPEIQTVKDAKELLQQQQQQQQRKLQQIQQEHYQKTSSDAIPPAPPVPVPLPASTKTPQEQRTFQQQYMEQQAALDRQSNDYSKANKLRRRTSDDEGDGVFPPQAKLVGAAEAMSTSITFAMNKFQQLLQPTPQSGGTSSRLVYTATSESFTSSLAAEEKKEGNEDDEPGLYNCTSMYSPRRNNSSRRKNRHKSKKYDLRSTPSAVSANSSITSSISSVTGVTNAIQQANFSAMLEEISPMMRMRNPESQHAVEITASSSSNTHEPLPPEDVQISTSTTFKTEEQVKAEKQRKWKRKMKLAQAEQKQEQAELGDDSINNNTSATATDSYSIDEDEEEEEEARTYNTVDDVDDDASDVSFGCRPGSNLVEILSSISGINVDSSKNFSSNSSKASKNSHNINPNNPVEVLQKVLSARCGVELISSSEDEDEDDGYSYQSDREERRRRRRRRKEAKRNRRLRKEKADDESLDDGSQDGREGRDRKMNERGRSRGRRVPSPSERTRGTSMNSKSSMHSETSLGDILGRRDEDSTGMPSEASKDPASGKKLDPRAERDRLELQLLQSKPNFRILGRHTQSKSAETTVISSGSSATPLAGTASANVSLATASIGSLDDDVSKADPTAVADNNDQGPTTGAASVSSDSPSKGSMKQSVTSIRNIKSVSFDESTISKPASTASVSPIANLDRSDPNFIKKFVTGFSHHGTPLLWHRSPAVVEPAGSSNASVVSASSGVEPEPIVAYLRLQSSKNGNSGLGSDGFANEQQSSTPGPPTYDAPRLVWYRTHVSAEGKKEEEIGHIDLFDIASFETASSMSASFIKALEVFPYSMPSRTLVIQLHRPPQGAMYSAQPEWFFPSDSTQSNMIVLEATSDGVATTLVLGMKWMVARLAFNLIVGNTAISCEMLRPEQQQPLPEDQVAVTGNEEDSMGPYRPPIVRRNKVMNDMTFYMCAKVSEKTNRYQEQTLSPSNYSLTNVQSI